MLICASFAFAADSESANEVDPKPPIHLDPVLRRALLKAIENLENEEETDDSSTTTESTTTEDSEILTTGDETDSKTKIQFSITDQEPSVQFHSFVVDGHKAFENKTDEATTKTEDVESATYKGLDPILVEDIDVKETNFNSLTQTRSIQSSIVAENNVAPKSKIESKKEEVSTKKPEPTTTTTTTPRPIFNEDGENIEELDNHEVQVFQAPLVAAFTVHQDAQGLPKSVVPIYKQAVRKPITPSLPITRMQLGTQSSKFQAQLNDISLNQFQNPQISQQLALQQQLELKQRLLEEQIQKLQNQQKQHEEQLRQQQYLHQQQLLFSQNEQQRQQQRILEEQKLRQQQYTEQQQRTSQNFVQNNQFRQQNFQKNVPTSVSFQPSISLPPSSLPIGISEQQLPQREAVDFLVRLRSGQQSPFPLQPNIPIVPSNQLQVPVDKPFTNNFVDKARQNSNVRVFRHDLSTGNLGINTNNGFNRNYQFSNNFRNIPLTPHHNRYSHDNELQNLLFQSGLAQGGRSQEDLSIVSKVLSLNHGVNFRNNFLNSNPNIHFGESKRIDVKSKPNFSV